MKRIIAIISLIAGLLTGCLPDPLPMGDITNLQPKIVVSSQILPAQGLVILLTRSFSALDANGNSDPQVLLEQIAINDALVTITGAGVTDTLDLIDTGIYGNITIPLVENESYLLQVESLSMGKVTATTQVKPSATFDSLSASINDTGFDTLANISYSLQDETGKNYYMINVQHITAGDTLEPSDFLNPRVFTYLTEDSETTDGEVLEDSFNAFFRRDFIPGDTVLVGLANIDAGYYNFLELRNNAQFNLSAFLGEPLNFPSNVEGGLGWFTLHLPDVRVINVED